MDFEELMNDSEFKAQIDEAKDLAEVAELFKARGFDTDEESLVAVLKSEDSDELDEKMLENVAGGAVVLKWPWVTSVSVSRVTVVKMVRRVRVLISRPRFYTIYKIR